MRCISICTAEELCFRPNENSNSIANLILHLNGNVRQWVFAGILGLNYKRNRPNEFIPKEGMSLSALQTVLEALKTDLLHYTPTITAELLDKTHSIQVYQETGFSALVHVIEHFSYHTGQIALLTKLIKNQDLGFYSGLAID